MSDEKRLHTNTKEPKRYKVTIYNDDFTTMEFVVMVLKVVFFKNDAEAEALMLKVHHSDKAVVGVYSYDVAVSKVRRATQMARDIKSLTPHPLSERRGSDMISF